MLYITLTTQKYVTVSKVLPKQGCWLNESMIYRIVLHIRKTVHKKHFSNNF